MEKDIKQKIEPASTCVEPLERTTAEVVDEFDGCLPLIRTGCYAYKSMHPDKSNSDIIEEVNKIFEDVTKASQNGDFAKYMVGLTEAEQADLELLSPNHKIGYCIYKSINPEKSYSEIISELDKALSPRGSLFPRLMGDVINLGAIHEPVDTSNLTFRQKIKRFFDGKDDEFI
jgi:hypothetical protein